MFFVGEDELVGGIDYNSLISSLKSLKIKIYQPAHVIMLIIIHWGHVLIEI